MDPLHQTVLNEADAGGGGEIPEPFVPAAAPEAPAAPAEAAPETSGWQQYTNDPEFQAYMAQQNAEMFDARLQALIANQPVDQEGQPTDYNALLDPMGDGFGQNLAQLFAAQEQRLSQMFQPVIEAQQHAAEIARTEAIAAPILAAHEAQHGPLSDEQHRVAMVLADNFTAEHERVYGAGNQRAQQLGLQQALSTIRAIAGSSAAAGRQEAVDQLHAATQGLRVPPAAGGSTPTVLRPPARSPQELLERHFGPNGMSPLQAA